MLMAGFIEFESPVDGKCLDTQINSILHPADTVAEFFLVTFSSSSPARGSGMRVSAFRGAAPMPPLTEDLKARHLVPAAPGTTEKPSVQELFQLLRPWGSIRSIGMGGMGGWVARVEFWYEVEAVSFEHALTMAKGFLGGRQLEVRRILKESS
jgi:hypothetical protein